MRQVTFRDGIDILERLVAEFISESRYPLTFSYENTSNTIMQRLADENSVMFIEGDYRQGTGGFISCCLDTAWHKEPFGYIDKFYVAKLSRGTPVGRSLFQAATDWFDEKNCVASFLTDTAGIQTDKRLINLAAKFSYIPCGTTLYRKQQ